MNANLTELHFRHKIFILLVWETKWLMWAMAATQPAENHSDKWGFTEYLHCGKIISVSTKSQSQNLVAAAQTLSLKLSSQVTSLNW